MNYKRDLLLSAKTCDIFIDFFPNFADRTEKSGPAVMAEPDRCFNKS